MATQDKDFKVKNGLQVGGPTNLVNYSSASPSNPFIGQLWVDSASDSPDGDLSSYLTITEYNNSLPANTFSPKSGNVLLSSEDAQQVYYWATSGSVTVFDGHGFSAGERLDIVTNAGPVVVSASASQSIIQTEVTITAGKAATLLYVDTNTWSLIGGTE